MTSGRSAPLPFKPIAPSSQDQLVLASGFESKILIRWKDPISATERFGSHNDFTHFMPLREGDPNDGLLWVNHEYYSPLFSSGVDYKKGDIRKKEDVLREQLEVGGSIVRIRREGPKGEWKVVENDPHNRRVTAQTAIPFAGGVKVARSAVAIGTLGNCSGGHTPWRTILTCEEYLNLYYGDRDYSGGKPGKIFTDACLFGWETVVQHPPEHYGWVVEVDPFTGAAKKHTSMGRFGHESATVVQARDGRCVVYSGDDDMDRCFYKFIADRPGTLETGTLYVADIERGRWIPLVRSLHPILKTNFKDQLDVMVRARLAALYVGGTKLDRPEDVDVDPVSGAVFVTLTNNTGRKNYFGSIMKIEENGADPLSLEFKASTFLRGGPETGFACPDNMAFDPHGGFWFTSDISGSAANKEPYESFKNNGLFYVPMSGPEAGRVFQIASAPIDAEFTGPSFSPDGRTLFLSVQHPGEESRSLAQLTSHWPEGGSAIPRSAVVTIQKGGPHLFV